MKQTLIQQIDCRIDTPLLVQVFIYLWQKKKGYPVTPILTIGICLELLIDTTRHLHQEEIAHGVFNYLLDSEDSMIAWQGDRQGLIVTLMWEVREAIKKRLKTASV